MVNHQSANYLSSRSTAGVMHSVPQREGNLRLLLDVAYRGDPYFSNV